MNQIIMEALQDSGLLEQGEIVTEAILVFATVNAEDCSSYGQICMNESMPVHHAIGLLTVALDRMNATEEAE